MVCMDAKVNSSDIVHRGRIFDLKRENITLPNGATTNLDIIRHPGAALMVPLIEDQVIMIKQYRHAVGKFIWELPAGTLNSGEDPLQCAKRELIEESGYSATEWHSLGKIVPVPAYSDEIIYLFLAKQLQSAGQNLDNDEVLEVHHIKFSVALEMAYKNEIQDSKTTTALFLADRFLAQV